MSVKFNFKTYSVFIIVIFLVGMLTLRFSEVFRGQNPLYTILKMIGWTMIFSSAIWSVFNTVEILFKKEQKILTKAFWGVISVMPFSYFM